MVDKAQPESKPKIERKEKHKLQYKVINFLKLLEPLLKRTANHNFPYTLLTYETIYAIIVSYDSKLSTGFAGNG